MADDSDDDFERFLQEDDSASMSSASPVKRKPSKDTTNSKKKAAAKAKSASSKSRSASSKAYGGGSSLSVVAAAEKLLAASGRAGAKKHAVVEDADEDEDEPPPSYSDDPYAFDLGEKSSRYSPKSEAEEEDSDGGANQYRASSRRSSKSGKGKIDDDASIKMKKSKGKSQEKKPTAMKGEAKSAKTLEDRIAEILKRTGSTTFPSTSTAIDDKAVDENEASDGYHDDSDSAAAEEGARTKGDVADMEIKDVPPVGSVREANSLVDKVGSGSDEGSESHRLSFSDSLGMESADFEVGAFAKRKLDRSRLSLSSLNSEKFAVNMDALEESEHVSQSRYDRQSEDFGRSLDTSEPAESDYDDDGFELDQTTEIGADGHESTAEKPPPTDTNANPSFVSQFESMKSLFSLDSPIKHVDSPIDAQRQEIFIESPDVRSGLPDSDNFGYDDEDFEVDEAPPTTEPNLPTIDETQTVASRQEPRDCGSSPLDDGNEQGTNVTGSAAESAFQQDLSLTEQKREQSTNNEPEQPIVRSPFQFEVVSTVVSVTETRAGSAAKTDEDVVPQAKAVSPSPPQLPPPPPPPDDEHEGDGKEEGHFSHNPPLSSVPPSLAPPPAIDGSSQVDRSANRFREIEHQISALRFLPNSSSTKRQNRGRGAASHREEAEQPMPIVDDPSTLQEIKEIELLVEQARRVRNERRKSASTRSSVKENELALRLQQAQRQLLQFKQHVQELAESVSDSEAPSPHDDATQLQASQAESPSNGQKVETPGRHPRDDKLSRKEIESLKKEVQSQERLIQGFQRENEQLMKQLKQLQRDLQYDAHKENELLRHQVKELRTLLDGSPHITSTSDGIEGKIQYRAAIEARLQAEAHVASLQEELKSQAGRHQDRVNELKLDLEKVKKAKIDLECQYEGINVKKMEAESQQIRILKEQLQTQQAEHDHAVNALQKKLDWYVRNQRLLDEQDEKMAEIKEENKRLKDEIATSKTPARGSSVARSPPTPAKGGPRLPSDVRRIQELESRLSDMEEAMRKRHPDSLVSLMVASRKADDESKLRELNEEHKRVVDQLMEEMERLEVNNEKKLSTFRQQQEKLVLQYQRQIAELERQQANKENVRRGSATQGKIQKKSTSTDEDELYRVRRFYAEKIKEVERKWEAKYRAVKKQHYAASGPPADNLAADQAESSPSDAARIIRTLQQKIASQEEEIRRIRGTGRSVSTRDDGGLQRRISSLELQLKTSEDARRHLIDTISSLTAMAPPSLSYEANSQRLVQEDQRREHELEAKLIASQREFEQSLTQYRDRIKTLEQQLAEESTTRQQLVSKTAGDTRDVARLQKALAEAEEEKRRLQQSAERAATLESEVMLLREQVSVPQTPSMLQFRSLELRIETLTQKHQLREAELKTLLAQATQSSQLEKLNYERMYRNAIALKNAEISTFKKQLGEILDELETLRRVRRSAV